MNQQGNQQGRFDYNDVFKGPVSQTYTNTKYEIQQVFHWVTSRRQALPQEARFLYSYYYSTVATIPTQLSLENFNEVRQGYFNHLLNVTLSVRLPHPIVMIKCTNQSNQSLIKDSLLPYIPDLGTVERSLNLTLHKLSNTLLGPGRSKAIPINAVPPLQMPSPETGSSSLIRIFPIIYSRCQTSINYLKHFTLLDFFIDKYYNVIGGYFKVLICTISAYQAYSDTKLLYTKGTSLARIPTALNTRFNSPHYNVLININASRISYLNDPNLYSALPCYQYAIEPMLANIFATTIADLPHDNLSYYSLLIKHTTPYIFKAKQYRFGYKASSTSARLAFSVVIAYCEIISGYLAYILITGYTSTAWNSALEIVMLALQSKVPDHLGHTSVGIHSLSTYQEAVGVRVNSNEKLELIFAHDQNTERHLGKVVGNKAYLMIRSGAQVPN